MKLPKRKGGTALQYFDRNKVYTKEELEKMLLYKQMMWAKYYVIDYNAVNAARKAGYSEAGLEMTAWRNKQNVVISAYVKMIESNLSIALEITKAKLMIELKQIAFANIDNIYINWEDLKDFDSIPLHIKACIKKIDYRELNTKFGINKTIHIEFYNKLDAIDKLNKMLGFNEPEQIETKSLNMNVTLTANDAHKILMGE